MVTALRKSNQEQYLFGEYLLTADGLLTKNNHEIHIPPKELNVLKLFLNSGGRIISKEEIFEHVWSNNIASDESLTRCIYALRRILCEDRNNRYIETIYGTGYRFKAQVTKIAPFQSNLNNQVHEDTISVAIFPFKMQNNQMLMHHSLIQGLTKYSCYGLTVLPAASTQDCNDFKSISELVNNLRPDYYITGREITQGQKTKLFIELVVAQNHKLIEHISLDYSSGTESVILLPQIISLMVNKIPHIQINSENLNEIPSFDMALNYLNARHELQKFTPESLQKALSLFQICINNHPNYPQSYSGLAECYISLSQLGMFHQKLALDNAVTAIDKALELEPTNANALSILALLSGLKGENSLAEILFKQAHLLMPGSSEVNYHHSTFYFITGRFKEALNLIDNCISSDPSKIAAIVLKLWLTFYFETNEKAFMLGETYINELSYRHPIILSMVTLFAALSGRNEKTEKYLSQLSSYNSFDIVSANKMYAKYILHKKKVSNEILNFIKQVDFYKMNASLLPLISIISSKKNMSELWARLKKENYPWLNVYLHDPRLKNDKELISSRKNHEEVA